MPSERGTSVAQALTRFIDSSPTASHAVKEASKRLEEAGFKKLEEKDKWELSPGEKRYVIRGTSAMIALRDRKSVV